MAILLIGTPGWVTNTARLLEDRTSHTHRVYSAGRLDRMRGLSERIEIVYDQNYAFTLQDTAAIRLAHSINHHLDGSPRE